MHSVNPKFGVGIQFVPLSPLADFVNQNPELPSIGCRLFGFLLRESPSVRSRRSHGPKFRVPLKG